MYRTDVVVIGAGVVGLAVARLLCLCGFEVVVLESELQFGSMTSARNSEVIHAGLYYPTGSLKAELCVRGRELLYAYARDRNVPFKRCGKLIVASDPSEIARLEAIAAQAELNGVHDLRRLTQKEVAELEPQVMCERALLSPSTGILDSHGLMNAFVGDIEAASGAIAYGSPVVSASASAQGIILEIGGADPSALISSRVVVSAGHGSIPLLKRLDGFPSAALPQQYYAKGNYFSLAGVRPPFQRLVYPVPVPGGLGVHATLDLGGQVRFGPDVQWVEGPDDLDVDPLRAADFYAAIRRFWPDLPDAALTPDYAGIRPKIHGPGEPAPDFLIAGPERHGVEGLVCLLGIESPGLTSCAAIAERVADRLAIQTKWSH